MRASWNGACVPAWIRSASWNGPSSSSSPGEQAAAAESGGARPRPAGRRRLVLERLDRRQRLRLAAGEHVRLAELGPPLDDPGLALLRLCLAYAAARSSAASAASGSPSPSSRSPTA